MFKKYKTHIIFFVVSLLLTVYWFRNGNTFGGGETGNPYYNLSQMFAISGWAWGNQILGGSSGLTVASAPVYGVLAFLQQNGVPGFVLQATFFFVVLFLTLYGMYALTRELFPRAKENVWVLSAFFYVVNPYAMMNVWNRFLLNTVLFYAVLPVGLLIFIRGLNSRKYFYAILLGLVTSLCSYAFGAPAQTIIFWFVLFFTGFFYFIFFEKSWFVVRYFLVSFFLWIIFNFWWVSQQIYFRFSQAYSVATDFFFSTAGNLNALTFLSNILGKVQNVLLLQHAPFFKEGYDLPFSWPTFYSLMPTLFLQWLVILAILAVAIRKIKERWILYFFTVFIIGVFFVKGNSPPLGELFTLLFQKISFLQFLRNPFEKTGILLAFGLSPLFGVAVVEVSNYFSQLNSRLSRLILYTGFFYVLIFFGFPFWTRLVFTGSNPPTNNLGVSLEIKVPNYYREADDWLQQQQGALFRFISFPLGGEGIFNNWGKGYAGAELSGVLFSTPSISYNTTIPFYNDLVKGIEELFLTQKDFYKVASIFNVKYLMLREDINFKLSYLRDPSYIEKVFEEKIMEKETNIQKTEEFEKLKFYKFSDEVFLPKIYSSNGVLFTNKIGDLKNLFIGGYKFGDVVLDISYLNDFKDNSWSYVLHPRATFEDYRLVRQISREPGILPYVGRIPSNKIYPVVLFKERMTSAFLLDPQRKTEYLIELLGKRLGEAEKAADLGDYGSLKKSLEFYKKALPETISAIKSNSLFGKTDSQIWRKQFVGVMFDTHLVVLDNLENKGGRDSYLTNLISELKNDLINYSKDFFITTQFRAVTNEDFKPERRWIYQFEVPQDGVYEFLFYEKNLNDYFEIPEETQVQVDENIVSRSFSKTQEDYLTLGSFNLDKGVHEIGFNYPIAINLLDSSKEVRISSKNERNLLKFPVKNFDPFSSYNILLHYDIKKGSGFSAALKQNVDTEIKGKFKYAYEKYFSPDNYWFEDKDFHDVFTPSKAADTLEFLLYADPWNNCVESMGFNPSLCKNEALRKSFNRETEVLVSDFEVKKLPGGVFLRKLGNPLTENAPKVEFTRENQTKYLVKVENSTQPFLFVFSELFDSGWKARIIDEDENIDEKKHVVANGYANAWIIDKPGDFDVVLEYEPQKFLYVGYIISGTSFLVGLIVLILIRKRKL